MKKIKWGCIGCGGIADRRTLPGMMLADNAELIAVMDVNPEFAENCKVFHIPIFVSLQPIIHLQNKRCGQHL